MLGALIILLLALLGAEGWCRWQLARASGFDREKTREQQFFLSGQTGQYANDSNPLIHRLGYKRIKGPDFNLVRGADGHEYRIMVLGGSAVMGFDNQIGYDWPSCLYTVLQRYDSDWQFRVLNAGVSGGLSFHENMQMHALRNYDVDLVIVYTGYNDLYYYFMEPDHFWRSQHLCQKRLGWINRTSDILAQHSLLYATLRYKIMQLKPPVVTQDQSRAPEPMQLLDDTHLKYFANHLQRQTTALLTQCRAMHVPVLYIVQPSLTDIERLRPLTNFEKAQRNRLVKNRGADWQRVTALGMPVLVDCIRSVCQAYDVPFVYFRSVVAPYSDLFYDDVHCHGIGMTVVGFEVAKLVQQKFLQRSTEGWGEMVKVH